MHAWVLAQDLASSSGQTQIACETGAGSASPDGGVLGAVEAEGEG